MMPDVFLESDFQPTVSGAKFMPQVKSSIVRSNSVIILQRGTKKLLPTEQSEEKLKRKREDWYVALCQSREAHSAKLQKKYHMLIQSHLLRSNISQAQLRKDAGIEVTIQKGKHFKTMGRSVAGKFYLYIEEAM